MQQNPGGNANSRQQTATAFSTATPRLDEPTLLALQQMGFFPQLFQNTPSTSSLDITSQNNELLKELIKAQMEGSAIQQQNKATKDLSRRRPSLMHDSGASVIAHNDVRPFQQPIDSKRMFHHQLSQSSDATAIIGQTPLPDPKEEEDEKEKRILSKRMDKIERERILATNSQKNAQKKARTSEAVLRQEPLLLAEEGKGSATDSDDEANEQSPAEALIERIYTENRRRASEMGRNMDSTVALAPNPYNGNANCGRFMTDDTARLREEYERGVQLLPMLVQAMRIQRERRQDTIENRRIIYEEQLAQWERKAAAYERSPKKIAKDLRHRELFEKTFVELRKSREEKERNTRVERSRFSLAQGGNGIPNASSETHFRFMSSSELPENEQVENDTENVHEKAFAAAIVPPTYETRPNRFFDNRNSIVENPLAEACAQIETFQNKWTELEKDVFMEKIAIYGKNFAAIAAFLPLKDVKECVQFYYMTKKRNNYKQKIGRRRKKIGRQGYRPPIMPRFGDSDENAQLRNYGRECTFVECLLCSARILVLESLSQQSRHEHPSFDHFGPVPSSLSQQQQIPICTKCQTQAQRNRTLNRCPLGICACVGGKRKMRPVRNVPEKFASLGIEHKRFLISRLKFPPSTNKCCTNCFKRISKDIEGLLLGELKTELDEFNSRTTGRTENGTVKPSLICGKEEEETEQMAESKSELGDELWTGMEGPPVKEMKLETKAEEEEDEFDEQFLIEPKTIPMDTETLSAADSLRSHFGSLTKGIPNRRHRSSLLSAWEPPTSSAPNLKNSEQHQPPLFSDITEVFSAQQNVLCPSTSIGKITETNPNVPSQFNAKITVKELISQSVGETKGDEMTKIVQAKGRPITMAKDRNTEQTNKSGETQRQDNLRRKSGLANALLPSPFSDGFASPTNNRLTSHRIASPACALTSNSLSEPTFEENPQKNNEMVMTSTLTTQSLPCYESLSEESDTEKGGEEVTTKKSSSGLCSASVAAAPLNFFSLLDLMDENEQQSQQRMEDDATDAMVDTAPSFSTVSPLQNQQQQQQRLSFFASAGQWAEANKRDKNGTEGGEAAECVYEPLSEDET
ncbi:hypothetical protein niasHS_006946 [Heterodera schachtii]|uniref:SANT domain-containing protein n=1 Tax=Heterodera schachtii TaxID=97005 RepID=A0ABD2JG59_HETSC